MSNGWNTHPFWHRCSGNASVKKLSNCTELACLHERIRSFQATNLLCCVAKASLLTTRSKVSIKSVNARWNVIIARGLIVSVSGEDHFRCESSCLQSELWLWVDAIDKYMQFFQDEPRKRFCYHTEEGNSTVAVVQHPTNLCFLFRMVKKYCFLQFSNTCLSLFKHICRSDNVINIFLALIRRRFQVYCSDFRRKWNIYSRRCGFFYSVNFRRSK